MLDDTMYGSGGGGGDGDPRHNRLKIHALAITESISDYCENMGLCESCLVNDLAGALVSYMRANGKDKHPEATDKHINIAVLARISVAADTIDRMVDGAADEGGADDEGGDDD